MNMFLESVNEHLPFIPFSWLNTTMMENRKILSTYDLDGFEKVNDLDILGLGKFSHSGSTVFVGLTHYSHKPIFAEETAVTWIPG